MRNIARTFLVLSLSVLMVGNGAAEKVRIGWADAGKAVNGRKVVVVLPDRGEVAGKVVDVQPDGLLLDVKKTEPPRLYGKGRTLLSRNDVSMIRLIRYRYVWQPVGAAAGFLLGGYAGYQAGIRTFGDNSGRKGLNLAIAVMAGITVLGYLIGREADRKTTVIEIIPADNVNMAAVRH